MCRKNDFHDLHEGLSTEDIDSPSSITVVCHSCRPLDRNFSGRTRIVLTFYDQSFIGHMNASIALCTRSSSSFDSSIRSLRRRRPPLIFASTATVGVRGRILNVAHFSSVTEGFQVFICNVVVLDLSDRRHFPWNILLPENLLMMSSFSAAFLFAASAFALRSLPGAVLATFAAGFI